jgi:hypothetical protein
VPIRIVFSVGDSLTFHVWALDDFGGAVASSLTQVVWRVIAVDDQFAGLSNVTTFVEQPSPGGLSLPVDTLHFQFRSDGDVFRYGFLAAEMKRREGRELVPGWDRIGAFSLPANGTWIVGTTDSAGANILVGTIPDAGEYYSATVNGVGTVFRGYSAVLEGIDLEFTLAVSDSPPAIVLLREETTSSVKGIMRLLTGVNIHSP